MQEVTFSDAEDLRQADRRLLGTAMLDAFNPPQASRVYAYPHLAHFLTLRAFHPDSLPDLGSALNGWTAPELGDLSAADPGLSALLSFCHVAAIVVFSEQDMDDLAANTLAKAERMGMRQARIDASVRVAASMTEHFKHWIAGDGYRETRTMDRFTSTKLPGHWIETPPDYTPALEPNWHRMRPFVIRDPADHVVPPPPIYSKDPGTPFHNMVKMVLDTSLALTEEQKAIALYWDDNPNISDHRGHLTTQEHRISPPGHWLNIISQVTRSRNSDLYRTSEAYAFAAVAMYDAILACWHEKFRTDVVRPITFIQENLLPEWRPLIQTPPFPEYPSGHSAVSAAAASVLDVLVGSDHAFSDSTEVLFGMGVRHFPSFQDAAWEVSLSRFYGGIHYMEGILVGNQQGRQVAAPILEHIDRTP